MRSVSLSSTTGRGGGRLPRVPASACPVTAMADHRNATLTLNYTVPPATVATVPIAGITPMGPTVRGAGRISSALGTGKRALRATVALLVLSARSVIAMADVAVSQE